MDTFAFDDLVLSLAKTAVSCNFSIVDADSAIWDGIRDAGYTWSRQPVSDEEYQKAVRVATPFVEELREFFDSIAWKYRRQR